MKSVIDSAGRIVIPSAIRSAAGIAIGTAVEIDLRDGVVTIEPAPTRVRLIRRGGLVVAQRDEGEGALEEKTVRGVRGSLRKRS